jgi:hypothetical protein
MTGGFAAPAKAATPSTTSSITPATTIRQATDADIVAPLYPLDLVWFSVMDPHGPGKLLVTISPNNLPVPAVAMNVTDAAGTYSNLLDYPASLYTETSAPSIKNNQLDFHRVASTEPGTKAYHLSVNDLGVVADLTFSEAQAGSAMQPINWDGQLVYWSSSIGTARVDGTITFPGASSPTIVSGWVGEEERMAGYFEHLSGHVGYEYAQSGNADGSADQVFVFPELDGSWRGILAHTATDGALTMCPDPQVSLSDYSVTEGYSYPRTVKASCGSLSRTYTVSTPHMFPNLVVASSTMSDGSSDLSGPHGATIQHLRNLGTGFLGLAVGGYPTDPLQPGLLR